MDTMQRSKAERDLVDRGFRFIAKQVCAACQVEFEWWKTPGRKLIPLTSSNLQPHWKKCKPAFGNHLPPTGPEPYFKWPYGYR
jgi:hypothetical protein